MVGAAVSGSAAFNASAARLPRWRLRLARAQVFNVLSGGAWLLPRRPLSRLVAVRGGEVHALTLKAMSENGVFLRNAVHLEVRFFNMSGRAISPSKSGIYNTAETYFFGDKADDGAGVPEQHAYFAVPKGAAFALLTLKRGAASVRVSVETQFSFTRVVNEQSGSLTEALAGRDEWKLRRHLSLASEKADRSTAHAILARLIYLFGRSPDRDLQRALRQLDAVVSPVDVSKADDKADSFEYSLCFNPPVYSDAGFCAWLDCEVARLRAAGVTKIHVPSGDEGLMRMLAAKHSGLSTVGAVPEHSEPVGIMRWLSHEEVISLAQAG